MITDVAYFNILYYYDIMLSGEAKMTDKSKDSCYPIDNSICSICLETIIDNDNDSSQRNRCSHIFHGACLKASIRNGNYNCPLCRQKIGEISLQQDKVLLRYAKMVKVGMSQEVIKQRMIVDGIHDNIINDFFTGGYYRSNFINEDEEKEEKSRNNEKINFDKYSKMLKMNINDEAVRIRMKSDNIPSNIIDQFFNDYMNNSTL